MKPPAQPSALAVAQRLPRLGRHGFTLIELLASMTILMMIVSILAVIFTESDRAWRAGTGRADSNAEGRAAVSQIAQDLQYAIADEMLTFRMREDGVKSGTQTHREKPTGVRYPWPPYSYGYTNSEICFVALAGKAERAASTNESATRNTRCLYYWVREATTNDNMDGIPMGRFELMRTEVSTHSRDPVRLARLPYNENPKGRWYEDYSAGGAGDRYDAAGRGVIAENITAFGLYAPDSSGALSRNYDSRDYANRLPEFVDVFVEVLSASDAQLAADMQLRLRKAGSPALQRSLQEFIDKNAQRYTTRVYFQNRSGYRPR